MRAGSEGAGSEEWRRREAGGPGVAPAAMAPPVGVAQAGMAPPAEGERAEAGAEAAARARMLYHGDGEALIEAAVSGASGGPAATAAAMAIELLFDRLAAGPADGEGAGAARDGLRELGAAAEAEVAERTAARRRVPSEALMRTNYRFDRPGTELVPLLEALAVRFGFLLAAQWGWPAGRALLARGEIEALHFDRLEPLAALDEPTARRAWALRRTPRRDLGRGATVLLLDPNRLILDWPQRLAAPGGPFRAAALLEALPRWVEFLAGLRLLEAPRARRLGAVLERVGRVLAPSLRAEAEDPAVTAAAGRLAAAGRP